MKPGNISIRAPSRPICQLCDYILQQPTRQRRFLTTSTLKATARRPVSRHHGAFPAISTRRVTSTAGAQEQAPELGQNELMQETKSQALRKELQETEKLVNNILESQSVPTEQEVLKAISALTSVATQAIDIRTRELQKTSKLNSQSSSASAILSLDKQSSRRSPRPTSNTYLPTPTYLSQLAETLLKHPTVFISPEVLAQYVNFQRLLHRPRSLPEIFHLYANKPVPLAGSSPPKYSKPSPKAAKQAIPSDVAEEALSAAIATKDLPLAIDIIDTTYCAPAFRRAKLVTKVYPPAILAGLTPAAFYLIAQEMAQWSGNIDPQTMTMYSFVGLLSYATFTGTLGYVAITTANDQMDRVTWATGMPLRDRWLREEERAAVDRVAGAWGFKEKWKRGDEEGEEWEGLREWIALRGMILDKPELMEGMQ